MHLRMITVGSLSHAEFRWDEHRARRHTYRPSIEPPDRHDSQWQAVWSLIGHLFATTLAFISLFTLCWLVSFSFDHLQSIHPFPGPIFWFISVLEIALFYLDAAASVIVLVLGVVRYLVVEGR